MKRRSIKFLAIIMAFVCALCAVNITAYAEQLKTETVNISYSSKLSKPKVSISTVSTKNPALKLSWKEVDGANKYYIYRKNSKSGSLKLIAKTSKLYYKDTNVSKNKTYYYKVRAYQIKNNKVVKKSDASSTVSKAIVSVDKVKTLKATTVSESKIKLSWNKASDATRYYLYYSTSKDGTYKSIGYVTKTSYTFSNLNSSTTYYFKVKSAKKLDSKVYKASYSSVVSAKTNSKDGEFIVDFKKISNKEAGYPTGSAITCLAMVLNHNGVDVTCDEIYEEFDCKLPYYKSDGKIWCDKTDTLFVGDPTTTDKKYGYGTDYSSIVRVCKQICSAKGMPEKAKSNFELWADDPDCVKKYLDEGNIYLVRINKNANPDGFWYNVKDGKGSALKVLRYGEEYGVLCGYTDKEEYIVYNPELDKFEKYDWYPSDMSSIFSAFYALKK